MQHFFVYLISPSSSVSHMQLSLTLSLSPCINTQTARCQTGSKKLIFSYREGGCYDDDDATGKTHENIVVYQTILIPPSYLEA